MAEVVVCPTCKFEVAIARKGGMAVCPVCNSFVMVLDLSKAKKKKVDDDSDESTEPDKPEPPEEKATCPECDECFVLKESRAHGAKCPACGTQVFKCDPAALAREEEAEREANRAKKAAKPHKSKRADETPAQIKAGSKPRKRRDDDDDDYDHDHPRGRRPAKRSGLSGGQIAGIVVLVALVVIGVPITLLVLAARPRAKPSEPQVAGPNLNLNPNLNPNPGIRPAPTAGIQWPEDTTVAEAVLPPVTAPFEVDPRLEQDARPV